MVFTIDKFSRSAFEVPRSSERGRPFVISKEEMSEAVRLSVLDTMREYNKRLDSIVRHWEKDNKPIFNPNVSINRQLGLSAIERTPIEFILENDLIFHFVSAGTKPHGINPVNVPNLSFTGFEIDDPDNFAAFERKVSEKVGVVRRNKKGRFIKPRPRNTLLASRAKTARQERSSVVFPKTYIAGTAHRQLSFTRPIYTGKVRLALKEPVGIDAPAFAVFHPGVKGRQLKEALITPSSSSSRIDLDTFYQERVQARVERSAGFEASNPSVSASAKKSFVPGLDRREFVMESGRVKFCC